jgi:hypothetical protein
VGRGSRRPTRLLQQHEPHEARRLRLPDQFDQESAQPYRLAAEFGACRFSRVSLVEDQINDLQDSPQPRR